MSIPSPGLGEDGSFDVRFQRAGVRETRSGGMQMDVNADGRAILDAIDAMEQRIIHQPRGDRMAMAGYLLDLARDLLKPEPHIQMTLEVAHGLAPMAVMTVTRRLYPDGHSANDEPTNAVFWP